MRSCGTVSGKAWKKNIRIVLEGLRGGGLALKEVVAEFTLENRLLEKIMVADGEVEE